MTFDVILHISLAFIVAGLWISLSTIAGERLGSRLGGLFANLPSNILVSLLFMALTRGPDYAAKAAGSVPVGMVVDTLFLLAVVAALRWGLVAALVAGLAAWFAGAALAVALPPLSPLWSIVLYVSVCAASFAVADFALKVRAVPKKAVPFRPSTILVRAIFAGTIVAGAVIAAQIAPPYLTGIVAVFPAVLLSTMAILTRTQGRYFARETGKVLILSSSNIIVYGVVVALLFPTIGPWWGTLCAFAAAAAYVALLLPLTKKIK
jgi:Na+-translocating ferredoxin:NAD+ oxidoreductase RnfD subunit